MSLSKADCGRLGGLITFLRVGPRGMSERGKQGGRPRAPTLERQQEPLGAQINAKEEMDTPSKLPDSLTELRRLYLHRKVEAVSAENIAKGRENLPGALPAGRG